ncbi:nuclear transport factor 2 family protein [Saccharopolyspora sp. NPDC047091]|uniref:nuclear transport factor 2 family protein n=1 Tax=Saccharopolyspora sp. NPDC047091 TaxID=3155924 RepID=UPI0033C8894C
MTERAPDTGAALDVARELVRAVEAKDLDAVARTLAAAVRQLFLHSRKTTTPEEVAEIVAGRGGRCCVADVAGRDEVPAYTRGLFAEFAPLRWRDHGWETTPDGAVFFRGKGDMVVARTGKPYRNAYVGRFEAADGRIVRMAEHGDVFRYAGLRVPPNGAEFRALLRAIGRPLHPARSATAGR